MKWIRLWIRPDGPPLVRHGEHGVPPGFEGHLVEVQAGSRKEAIRVYQQSQRDVSVDDDPAEWGRVEAFRRRVRLTTEEVRQDG